MPPPAAHISPPPSSATSADPDHADPLLAFLADRNVGCPSCEYNLRDLQSYICPECGVTLSLNTILGADPDFSRRRRDLIRAWIILAIGGLLAPAIAAALARGPSVLLAFLPPLGVLVSAAAAAVALIWDNAIYNDRIRFPRARTIPSFRPIVRALIVTLYLELALDLVVCIIAVIP